MRNEIFFHLIVCGVWFFAIEEKLTVIFILHSANSLNSIFNCSAFSNGSLDNFISF